MATKACGSSSRVFRNCGMAPIELTGVEEPEAQGLTGHDGERVELEGAPRLRDRLVEAAHTVRYAE